MHKQQGMTFIGMLLTMATVIIAAILVMRAVPVYLQYYSIIESIKSLNAVPVASLTGDSYSDVEVLRGRLNKHLEINGLDNLKPDQLTIVPNGTNKFTVKLKYQIVRPLLYNISLLFDFNDTQEVVTGSEN
ncbi:DUF4845 domain-containing protein [Legionella drancourtii]|uniref:Transmembrane protein n=1 Tax=Legionella drancourtii LLAP12 TaxID=658187 RepID=G9ER01_9GAMM|nr:DUF4845 domain-containing protein [Legionella drancourtii]EHL30372.1 hypothetical protein LDG_7705 [Legionella drancourtii LLAP12]